MKKVFIDLSNILVSKKEKVDMTYAQQEFFKCIVSESLKSEIKKTALKFKSC